MSIIENLKPIIDEMGKYISPERLEVFIGGLELAALIDYERVNYSFMSLLADSELRGTESIATEFEGELIQQLLATVRKYEIRMVTVPTPSIPTLTRIIHSLELVFDYTETDTVLGYLKDELLENKEKIAQIVNLFFDIDTDEFADEIDYVSDDLIERFIEEMEKRTETDAESEGVDDEVLRQEVATRFLKEFPVIQPIWDIVVDRHIAIGLELSSLLSMIPLEEGNRYHMYHFVFLMIISNTPLGESTMFSRFERDYPFNTATANNELFRTLRQRVLDYANEYHQ